MIDSIHATCHNIPTGTRKVAGYVTGSAEIRWTRTDWDRFDPRHTGLVRIDRARKGKKLSNEDWISKTDPEAKIAKLKDGRTHLAYKPEHAVDLDTGIIVAAALHPADDGWWTTRLYQCRPRYEHLRDCWPTA